jgi:hypothetical protein
MVCPRCGFSLEQEFSGRCPKCGTNYSRATSVVMKTSAVLIAAGGGCQLYKSVSEVPPNLRRTLQESTNSRNSATILIADRRGKEEIAKALERISETPPALVPVNVERNFALCWRNWAGVAIVVASGLIAWFVCIHRW